MSGAPVSINGRLYDVVAEENGCDGCAFAPLSSDGCDRAHDAALASGRDGCGWSKTIFVERQCR